MNPKLVDYVAVRADGSANVGWALIRSGQAVVHNLNAATWPPEIQPESQGKLLEEVFTEKTGFSGFAVGHLAYGAANLNLQTYVNPVFNLLEGSEEGKPPKPLLDYSNVSLYERSILELLAAASKRDLVELNRRRIGALKPLKAGYNYRYHQRGELGPASIIPEPHPLLLIDLSP